MRKKVDCLFGMLKRQVGMGLLIFLWKGLFILAGWGHFKLSVKVRAKTVLSGDITAFIRPGLTPSSFQLTPLFLSSRPTLISCDNASLDIQSHPAYTFFVPKQVLIKIKFWQHESLQRVAGQYLFVLIHPRQNRPVPINLFCCYSSIQFYFCANIFFNLKNRFNVNRQMI